MAYKFIGRIKRIGIDKSGNFCEFSADNNIKIDGIAETSAGALFQLIVFLIKKED